jgi:hypothetical protein
LDKTRLMAPCQVKVAEVKRLHGKQHSRSRTGLRRRQQGHDVRGRSPLQDQAGHGPHRPIDAREKRLEALHDKHTRTIAPARSLAAETPALERSYSDLVTQANALTSSGMPLSRVRSYRCTRSKPQWAPLLNPVP